MPTILDKFTVNSLLVLHVREFDALLNLEWIAVTSIFKTPASETNLADLIYPKQFHL